MMLGILDQNWAGLGRTEPHCGGGRGLPGGIKGVTNKDEDQENSITPWADGPANIYIERERERFTADRFKITKWSSASSLFTSNTRIWETVQRSFRVLDWLRETYK